MAYITIREAAERLGVSPQTIHNWIHWGAIKGYELYRNPDSQRPGRILVEEHDLNRFAGKLKEAAGHGHHGSHR